MSPMDELLGESRAIAVVREQAAQLLARAQRAHRLPPILLLGETGTGKGLLARLLHRGGPRRDGPFIDVSCAAIPDTLLEAELFGFERGAFTDARQAKAGLLQAAHQGTIFLDELALLPGTFQAKLLKAIEERAVRRLGSTRTEAVDVQIIAASNEDLAAAVRNQRFRDDLYHRLAVVTLTLPPLRDRAEDVLLLAEHFLSRACAEYGLVPPRRFAPDARSALLEYPWPGNVRQLSNVVESAVLLADNSTITAPMLRLPPRSSTNARWSRFDEQLGDLDPEKLLGALHDTNWNVSRAAIRLGISRNRLRYRIEKHRLHADRYVLRSGQRHVQSSERAAPTSAVDPLSAVELRWEPRHMALLRAELVPAATTASRDSVRAITTITDKIRSFGGQVQELAAMRVVGVFGFEPLENAPNSAALAALAIQKAAERARRVDSRILAVKIAVHAGQLMIDRVNRIAQIKLEDKGAAEPTLAALSHLGQADSILISAPAALFLERRFELVPQPCRTLGGQVFRLIGPERMGFGLGGRALTRFVGRQRELAIVYDQLAQAERGRGQVVAIVGEAGVGKSRLVYELTHTDRTRGWRILSCRGIAYALTTPSLPVVELLKSYFDIEDRDDARRVREKATGKLLTLDRALEPNLVPLLALLDAAVDDESWKQLDPVQKRLRTLDACKRLLLREAQVQPLAVVVEDLQWIDTETQALLDGLIESLPTARLLLLVNYRPEYQHRWGAKTYYTQLRIDPLTGDDAEALLKPLLGDDESLRPLRRLLIDRTEGNPLFLEESVRTLVETGELKGSRGDYRLAAPLTSVQMPSTVQAILAARIDRLSPEDKRLLQAAAVVGKDVPFAVLQAVAELGEEASHQGLANLQAAEFLYEARLFPDLEYTFKHALTHEAAYGTMLRERRRTLHARILEAIERLYPTRLAEQLERLGHHAFRGEVWDKALLYLRQAGEKAVDRSAHREAVASFEQAIAALAHLPESKQTLGQAVDLRILLRVPLLALSEFSRLLEHSRQAEALANKLDDPLRCGWVAANLCQVCRFMGEVAEAIEHGQRAVALAAAIDDKDLHAAADFYLGAVYWLSGRFRDAVDLFTRHTESPTSKVSQATATAGQGPTHRLILLWTQVWTQAMATWCLAELGRFEEAIACGAQAQRAAAALGLSWASGGAHMNLGVAHLLRGNLAQAVALLERSREIARIAELSDLLLTSAGPLGRAYNLLERIAESIVMLEKASQVAEMTKSRANAILALTPLGEAYARAGQAQQAQATLQRALELARQHGMRGYEAWALYTAGNLHAEPEFGNAVAARQDYSEALALAQELKMRPLQAQCHLGLGQLAQRSGQRPQAREQLIEAAAMFREMGMEFWLEKAGAALAEQ